MEYIYTITNTINKRVYVGKTQNFDARRSRHLSNLRSGNHSNKELQADFYRYGEEVFEFEVVQMGDDLEESGTEKTWMLALKTYDEKYGYNRCDPFFMSKDGNKQKVLVDIENGFPPQINKRYGEPMDEVKDALHISGKDLDKIIEAFRCAILFEPLSDRKEQYLRGYLKCLLNDNISEKDDEEIPRDTDRGIWLRKKMEKKGVTMKQIADAVGKTESTISKKINGTVPFFIDEIDEIGDYLGLSDKEKAKWAFGYSGRKS